MFVRGDLASCDLDKPHCDAKSGEFLGVTIGNSRGDNCSNGAHTETSAYLPRFVFYWVRNETHYHNMMHIFGATHGETSISLATSS